MNDRCTSVAEFLGQADQAALNELARVVLGTVLRQDDQRRSNLLATVTAMRATETYAAAASSLSITVSGLTDRVEVLRSLTSMDIRRPDERLLLELALYAAEITLGHRV